MEKYAVWFLFLRYFFKVDMEIVIEVVIDFFKIIWEEDDWIEGFVVKFRKIGDFSNCDNWRGIYCN